MKRLRIPILLLLALTPSLLGGGSCAFRSSSGDKTVVVATGDCVNPDPDGTGCLDPPEPSAATLVEGAPETPVAFGAPAVPGPGPALLASLALAIALSARRAIGSRPA